MSKINSEDKLVMEELERKRKKTQEKEEKQAKKEKKKQNNEIMKATIFFSVIFFAMVVYYGYIITVNSETIVNNSYNSRLEEYAEINIRGGIYTNGGKAVAYTETDKNGKEKRVYPYDNLFAHIVGMNVHGKTGIEKAYDYYLLTTNINPIRRVINEFKGEKNIGNDVVTTLNLKLQQAAYDSLGDYDGAAVVLDNDTGKILAMVSKPDYNPNDLEKLWEELEGNKKENSDKNPENTSKQESFLLNRATQGLYTPGSVFKIFTSLEYMRQNNEYKEFKYDCEGKNTFANYTINCYNRRKHGAESLTEAFAYSCNGAFATIGTMLDNNSFSANMKALLFNSKLPIGLEYSKSSFNISEESSTFDITQSAIGQGTTLVTPIHMAMIVQAIVNEGVMMVPYVVSEIDGSNGAVIKAYEPQKYGQVMTKNEASYLEEMMGAVTEYGTGSILADVEYKCGGKTGTAQIDSEDNVNSWFAGYANKGKKDITVSVVIENVPDGSIKAVECAKEIFDAYFD